MLVIIGMILLLTWIFDHAFHLTADSLINLLLIFASISFALDFVREDKVMDPRPGWDARPARFGSGSIARWLRHRLNPSPVPAEASSRKPAADQKGPA
ncbi:MAG: DUF5670 family protein [Candidatus Acidiferrum sp.]|jgi:uncharacterized protein DUF5670